MDLTSVIGLTAIALLGSLFAASDWLRLAWGQKLPALIAHSMLTHALVLAPLAWISGLDFVRLVTWDASILLVSYITYCAYRAYLLVVDEIRFGYAPHSKLKLFSALVEMFVIYLGHRAVTYFSPANK